MTELDLTPFHITRPEKVRWFFPTDHANVLDSIPSKSLRAFLANTNTILADHNIRWEYKPVTEQEYLAWLPYYQQKMSENQYDVIANETWYADRVKDGFTIEGMFFYQNDGLIGSGIFCRRGNQEIRFSFKASDRIKIPANSKGSLGAVIDYIYLLEMLKQGITKISGGKSRNAFGVINKLGYLDFWLRFGFYPETAEDTTQLNSAPLAEDGTVLFYGMKDNTWTLFAFKPNGHSTSLFQEIYTAGKIPFQEISY